ncbi:MAG: antitoxin Xre/MbcA/ParS toxin-binding domain-containing protein [Candidatus Cybelea sp.]
MAVSLPSSAQRVLNNNGSVDSEGLAACLGLRTSELSRALGVAPSTVIRGAHSPRAQEQMRRIYSLFVRVAHLFNQNEEHARVWLNAPNPELDFKRPIDYIIDGRLSVLGAFLSSIEEGAP